MRSAVAASTAARADWLRGRPMALRRYRTPRLDILRDVSSRNFGWPGVVDEILAGDQAVMLASVTPAKGVVLAPVTNFATRDRRAGTVTVNSSVGAGRKLERIARDPHVALAFHTRAHAETDRPEYVLVQGTATISEPIDGYPDTIGEQWDRRGDPRPQSRLWKRWLRVYHRRV